MLPEVITRQPKLLTIDTTRVPFVRDALLPGIRVQPLFLDPQNGVWVLRVLFPPGITLPRHFHTGSVHLWTISGRWHYVEHPDQPQTAGCYLYEPGGSVHQLHTPESNTEDTDTFMVVTGCNVNFADDGAFLNIMDAGWIENMVNQLAADQRLGSLEYIHGQGARYAPT